MFSFIYSYSDLAGFVFFCALTIIFSVCIILLSRRFIFSKLLHDDNVITASVASLIGIIYGVLAGFIAVYLLGINDHAASAVLNESNAVANIYRDSKSLEQPAQQHIQSLLKQYVSNVVGIEWPEMSKGKSPHGKDHQFINKIAQELHAYKISTPADNIIITDLTQEVKSLFNAREERIESSEATLTPEIWFVLVIGTILIIVINYAFRVNFYLHLFTITVFSIMAASIFFLLVELDRPFQGEFAVQPHTMLTVQRIMNEE